MDSFDVNKWIFNFIFFLQYFHFIYISASKCPPLPEVEHATANQLAGKGLNYGTVIRYLCPFLENIFINQQYARFECEPGYERSGLPTLLCQSNGTWSSSVPNCTRKRCFNFPVIKDGFVERQAEKPYYYQVNTYIGSF